MAETDQTPDVRQRQKIDRMIEAITLSEGRGALSKINTNAFMGHNIKGGGIALPDNKDNQGLTFFTRPRLNLTYDNAAISRILLPFITADYESVNRAIRVILDPVSQQGGSNDSHFRGGFKGAGGGVSSNAISIKVPEVVDSPLVDELSPFIPLLSNSLISLSGWPDEVLDTYTSDPGVSKETFSIADTYVRNYENFDLTATFKNTRGDAVTKLIRVLMEYMGRVHEGSMVPYVDSLMETEIDYQMRIYRLVLDPTRTIVQKIGSALAGFPTANPIGSSFNFNQGKPFNEDNAQITMPLRCVGAEYEDPILITEFNDVTFMFNPALEKSVENARRPTGQQAGNQPYLRISQEDKGLFNFYAYPVIHEETRVLEWWVSRAVYNYVRDRYYNDQ